MAEFTPHTKYDIGSQYYSVVAGLLSESADLGKKVDTGDIRSIKPRLATLRQWTRCISAIINDEELKKLESIAKKADSKIIGKTIKKMSVVNDMNDLERELYVMMKKYKMLTKMESSISWEDRMRDNLGIKRKRTE